MSDTSPNADSLLWEETVPGGNHWSGLLRRGTRLRLTALSDGPNVSLLLFNQEEKLERYNAADTLKAQHTARLTAGHVCYSDMGRILCSIVDDSVGWHDPIGAISDAAMVRAKYGVKRFQEARNAMYRSARDGLLVELGKYGLGRRDLVATVNLFSKVAVDDEGNMHFVEGHAKQGDHVDLRFEMNTLVVFSTAQHPLDPNPEYGPRSVLLSARRGASVAADDPCRTHCAENGRGFVNTERYYAA